MKPSEAQTRKELIDKALAESGWNVDDQTQVRIEFVINVANSVQEPAVSYGKRGFSDYVL